MYDAILNGNIDFVARALENDVSPNAVKNLHVLKDFEFKLSMLHIASKVFFKKKKEMEVYFDLINFSF